MVSFPHIVRLFFNLFYFPTPNVKKELNSHFTYLIQLNTFDFCSYFPNNEKVMFHEHYLAFLALWEFTEKRRDSPADALVISPRKISSNGYRFFMSEAPL